MVFHTVAAQSRTSSWRLGQAIKRQASLISTDHHGTGDGKPMTLTFSDVAVKLTGSDT